ncbi:MAG: hypothetical protein IJW49_10955 [Clostridia bacterium]|nr:hypothetical protein [Clostridia bacterium]
MTSDSQTTKQNSESANEEDVFEGMSEETRKLFTHALFKSVEMETRKIEEKYIEIPPPSRRHKIRMNRLFRERVGGSFLPFPEADNLYERIRSRLVIKLKINEFLARFEKCKRKK